MPDDKLQKTLDRAVKISTGGRAACARPGQVQLARDILATLEDRGQHAAEAPTGSGKSLAVLVPAMLLAKRGERTVVSTETKNLQKQVFTKDGPAAAKAVEATTGYLPKVALLKGWSNYGCVLNAKSVIDDIEGKWSDRTKELASWVISESELLGSHSRDNGSADYLGDRDSCEPAPSNEEWTAVSMSSGECPGPENCRFGATCLPAAARKRCVDANVIVVNHSLIAIQSVKDIPVIIGNGKIGNIDHLVADEAHGLPASVRSAGEVEVSADRIANLAKRLGQLLGMKDKTVADGIELAVDIDRRFMSLSAPQNTREDQLDGRLRIDVDLAPDDYVLHGYLGKINAWAEAVQEAVQAFVNRDTQAKTNASHRLVWLEKAVTTGEARNLRATVSRWLGEEIAIIEHHGPQGYFDFHSTMTKLRQLQRMALKDLSKDKALKWLREAEKLLESSSLRRTSLIHRVSNGFNSLQDAVLLDRDEDYAKWFTKPEQSTKRSTSFSDIKLKAAPISSGKFLANGLYRYKERHPRNDRREGAGDDGLDSPSQIGAAQDPRLSVVVLSATLPQTLLPDLAITAPRHEYPSPFDDAYRRSLLYIPTIRLPQLPQALTPIKYETHYGRQVPQLDLKKHIEWAAEVICRLVATNGGSALVLAATKEALRVYADSLRKISKGRFDVHVQEDGGLASPVMAERWRNDHSSVLVGTKQFMTGLDAPGATCSLVIVDRPLRAPSNPLDDARAARLRDETGIGAFEAQTRVYVGDAALLLEQAAGRLVRSTSDTGMVAVLDPRLALVEVRYSERSQEAYMNALRRFVTETNDYSEAMTYLGQRQLPAAS